MFLTKQDKIQELRDINLAGLKTHALGTDFLKSLESLESKATCQQRKIIVFLSGPGYLVV